MDPHGFVRFLHYSIGVPLQAVICLWYRGNRKFLHYPLSKGLAGLEVYTALKHCYHPASGRSPLIIYDIAPKNINVYNKEAAPDHCAVVSEHALLGEAPIRR